MKSLVHVLLLGLVLVPSTHADQPKKPPLTVTYVANEGFMIEYEDTKVLIDALFGGWQATWCYTPADTLIELMTAARPPFDNVDLIAVTHAHVDHFNADIVAAHLKHNRRGVVVCPPQALEKLEASAYYPEIESRIRVVPAPGDSAVAMALAGLDLLVLPTSHGPFWETDEKTGDTVDRHRNVQHLEFVITMDGRTLFHCGDSGLDDFERYRAFGLDRGHIDLAFLHWWGVWDDADSCQTLARELIRPEQIVLMHLIPGREPSAQPEQQEPVARKVVVPQHPMEKWTFR